jgi:hypothetical protein
VANNAATASRLEGRVCLLCDFYVVTVTPPPSNNRIGGVDSRFQSGLRTFLEAHGSACRSLDLNQNNDIEEHRDSSETNVVCLHGRHNAATELLRIGRSVLESKLQHGRRVVMPVYPIGWWFWSQPDGKHQHGK